MAAFFRFGAGGTDKQRGVFYGTFFIINNGYGNEKTLENIQFTIWVN